MKTPKKTQSIPDQALLKAASKGNLGEVKRRIAAGADVNAAPKDEPPPIFAAIGSGKVEVVQALLAAGADPNRVAYPSGGASVKSTPLCYAISENDWAMTEALLKAGAEIGLSPWGDHNAAGEAAEQATRAYYTLIAPEKSWFGERRTRAVLEKAKTDCARWMQFVRDAIARGVKVRDYWLWNAVNHSHDELALFLISSGVNVNAAPHGSSALERAIEHGRDDVAIALIKAGANLKPERGAPPLLIAAQKNRLAVVSALLEAKADVNVTGDIAIGTSRRGLSASATIAEASTALIVATRMGNHPMVELLLQHDADVNLGDNHGVTALSWALRGDKKEIAAALRNAGAADPEFIEGSLPTAFWSAAKQGDAAKVTALLQRGIDVNQTVKDREGKHLPLVSAAREGHIEVVELLLRHGANVNATANENWAAGITPLMAAARKGLVHVVKVLLAAGADLHLKDEAFEDGGETALHYAARGGHVEVIDALLAAGAKINAKAKGGATPLLAAVSNNRRAAIKGLLAAGADPNAGPADGSGPLYTATSKRNTEIVKLLLEHGAQTVARSKKPISTPLGAAAGDGSVEIVRLLLEAGAPVDAQDVMGYTALSTAALYGHDEILKILLKAGANPNIADREGFTPLMAAARSGKAAAVQLLLDAGADVHASCSDERAAIKIAREEKNQEVLALLEAAVAKQPPPKKAAKKPAIASQEGEKADEEFEAPDFSEAAARPEFRAVAKKVEKLCECESKPLGDIEGGYSFNVPRKLAEKLLAEQHSLLLTEGAYLFRHHRDHHDVEDQLGLLPTRDWTDLIRTFQTNGANYDLMPADIARWLQKLSAKHPFLITGVGSDWLEGRFTSPISNGRKLAHEMYEFCPDIVDQGIGSVKDLARALEKDGYFFFWWD